MDRFIADSEVVLMMLAFAALVYFSAYNFINPKRTGPSVRQTMVGLAWAACGLIIGLVLVFVLHLSSTLIYTLSIVWVVCALLVSRLKPNISATK